MKPPAMGVVHSGAPPNKRNSQGLLPVLACDSGGRSATNHSFQLIPFLTRQVGEAGSGPFVLSLALAILSVSSLAGQEAAVSDSIIEMGDLVRVSSPHELVPHVEPHLAVNPLDSKNLIVSAAAFPSPGRSHELRVYTSFDGGRNWSASSVETEKGDGIDSWLDFDSKGLAYLVTLTPARVRVSEDGGRSWSEPKDVPNGGYGPFDYPKLVIDRGPESLGQGHIYLIASQSVGRGVSPVSVSRSTNGSQFSTPVHVLPNNFNNQNGGAVVLHDGTLVVSFHELSVKGEFLKNPRLWVARSSDHGGSFGNPQLVTEGFLSDSPSLAVDRESQKIYATWMGLSGDFGFYLSASQDGGESWTGPKMVNNIEAARPSHSPAIAVNDDGIVGLSWFQPVARTAGTCFELRATLSSDHGESFLPSQVVSSEAACPNVPRNMVTFNASDTTIAKRFASGGDYHGFVALSEGRFLVVWPEVGDGGFELVSRKLSTRARGDGAAR